MRIGSRRWRTPSRSSKLGEGNTMRVVLTGLTGRRHHKHQNCRRLTLGMMQKKGTAQETLVSYDPVRGARGRSQESRGRPRAQQKS